MTTPFAAEHMAAEISRLRVELEKANEQSEHFERQWYLRGDEIEALNAKLGEQQSAGVVMPERKDDQGAPTVNLHIFREGWNACLDEFARLNGSKDQ